MGVPKHHTAANAAWKRRADFCNSSDNTKACQDPEPRASHSIFPLCLVTRGQILFTVEIVLFSRGFRRAWGWVRARGAVSGRAGRSPEPSLLPGLSGGSTRISPSTIRPMAQAVFSTGHFPSTVTLCVRVSVSLARAQPSVSGWGDLHDTTGLCTVIQRLLINVGGMMGLALECQEKKDHGLSSGAQRDLFWCLKLLRLQLRLHSTNTLWSFLNTAGRNLTWVINSCY